MYWVPPLPPPTWNDRCNANASIPLPCLPSSHRGPLSLGTTGTPGAGQFSAVGGPMCCSVSSSLPGLYPLDTT